MEASRSCRSLHHEKLVIAKDTLPLRVIDVEGTLARRAAGCVVFIVPSDWSFHVLSHTWSQPIREFSKVVGDSIAIHPTGPSDQYDPQSLYNHAFRDANFCHVPGYQHLISLLELLLQDGVHKLWFDALCINQAESESTSFNPSIARSINITEKEREIMNMGAYYTHSAGCFVINHGLGRGYELLAQDDQGQLCLPRWFTRVWTLQEFLLPSKLTFLVSAATSLGKPKFFSLMEEVAPVQSCRLCNITKCVPVGAARHYARHDDEIKESLSMMQQNSDHAHDDDPSSREMGITKMLLCTTCNAELPLIRKACKGTDNQVYFVDRVAYFGIVWLQHGPYGDNADAYSRWQVLIRELFSMLSMCSICSSSWLCFSVQQRNCSQEEDRILSILALLGLHGNNMLQQVRTKQTLEEQLLKVARTLSVLNPNLLLHLCIKDIICSTNKAGMSWIPNLRPNFLEEDEDTTLIDHAMSAFVRNIWHLHNAEVQLKEVTRDEGALKLEGNVMGARIVVGARGSMQQHCNEVDCHTCLSMSSAFDSPETTLMHQTMDCHLEVPAHANLSVPLCAHAFLSVRVFGRYVVIRQKGCIIRLLSPQTDADLCVECEERLKTGGIYLPIPCLHFLQSIDVSLLLWGDDGDGSAIVMVCMGTREQLHKIGVLILKSDVANVIFSTNKTTSKYLLGGFEREDVREFWRMWGLVNSVRCNCHGTVTMKALRSFMGNLKTRSKFYGYHKYGAFPSSHHNIGPFPGLSLMSSFLTTNNSSSHQKCMHGHHNLRDKRQRLIRRALLPCQKGFPPTPEASFHRANPDHVILGIGSEYFGRRRL